MGLTEEDLATRAGTTVERLRELIAIGIIRPGPSARDPFTEGDALRVQLVEHLADSGIAPTSVATAIERGALSLSFLDNLPGPAPRLERTHADLCDELGTELHRRAVNPDAAVFADLSGYTALTDRLGDQVSVDIALRLAELTQDVAERHGGRVVKMLGDGVHFIFDEPANAVLGSLDFVDSVEPRGLPPAHIGINAGPITYTDGDYYGLAVIIAAGIASTAGPGEVLVGESVVQTGAPEGVGFEEMGPVELKGVRRPERIFRAVKEAAVEGTARPGRSS